MSSAGGSVGGSGRVDVGRLELPRTSALAPRREPTVGALRHHDVDPAVHGTGSAKSSQPGRSRAGRRRPLGCGEQRRPRSAARQRQRPVVQHDVRRGCGRCHRRRRSSDRTPRSSNVLRCSWRRATTSCLATRELVEVVGTDDAVHRSSADAGCRPARLDRLSRASSCGRPAAARHRVDTARSADLETTRRARTRRCRLKIRGVGGATERRPGDAVASLPWRTLPSASSTPGSGASRSLARCSTSCRTSRSSTTATPRASPTARGRSPRSGPTRSSASTTWSTRA